MPEHQPIDVPDHRARADRDFDALRAEAIRDFLGLAHPEPRTDSLGYDDEPEPDIRARAQRILITPLAEPDYTGPDADVDALRAAVRDARGTADVGPAYLAAIRAGVHLRARDHRGTGDTNHAIADAQHAPRYLDDEPGDPSYD